MSSPGIHLSNEESDTQVQPAPSYIMADPYPAKGLAAAFPAPPPFYHHFTAQNLARLEEIRRQKDAVDVDTLPVDLQFLVPPPVPVTGTYRSFGDLYHVVDPLPSLEEQGIEQLYPAAPDPKQGNVTDGTLSDWTLNRAFHLQKIVKSLLLNFMELVGVLGTDPSEYGNKLEDLRTLFVNAHHLLNEYRPHQARETLILMMQEQLHRTRAETEGIYRIKSKVEDVLRRVANDAGQAANNASEANGHAEKHETTGKLALQEQREVWQAFKTEIRP